MTDLSCSTADNLRTDLPNVNIQGTGDKFEIQFEEVEAKIP